jgi:hypothetical protein
VVQPSVRFFFHHQLHQPHTGFTQQLAAAILDQLHYLQQRQHQLHTRSILSELAKLANGSLLPKLVRDTVFSLHSDSPFLTRQKLDQRLSRPWLESRYSQLFSTNFRTSCEAGADKTHWQ